MKSLLWSILFVVMTFVLGCGDPADKPADAKPADAKPADAKPANAKPAVDTPESISREIMANMRAMTDAFNSITDNASAEAAIPKIQAARASMRDTASRAKKVRMPSRTAEAELQAKIGKEQQETMAAFFESRRKLDEKPELLAIIAPALEGIENDMK